MHLGIVAVVIKQGRIERAQIAVGVVKLGKHVGIAHQAGHGLYCNGKFRSQLQAHGEFSALKLLHRNH